MRKLALIFCIACASLAEAQVVKVDHFYAHTTHAPELFELFKTTFKLPPVYDYQEFGSVSSGGLWLGNITLEFVNYSGLGAEKALFKGLALEPVQHTDTIVQLLDDYGVIYGPPAPVRFTVDGVEKTYWTNIVLKELSSNDIRVFICDYTDRSFLSDPKKKANKIFTDQAGGPLGIIGLRKIVVAASNMEKALHAWVSIPGAKKTGNHFTFIDGPEIILEKSDKDGIKEIQVQVRSVEAASKFLTENQMLSVENKTTMIDPRKVFGLRIILEQ
ncbi:MAG: hypothetical protein V4539_05675 [Bacteroidota bacterium]